MFINKVKELVKEQQQEVEQAVIGKGKYQFREEYQYLEVPEIKWFTMNTEQRRNHFSNVQSTQVSEASENCSQIDALKFSNITTSESGHTGQTRSLSLDFESAARQVHICLEGIYVGYGESSH